MRRLIAFDPGVTTGVAYTDVGGQDIVTVHIVGSMSHRMIWDTLEVYKPEVIIRERFSYQRRDKVVLEPVSINGAIQTWFEVRGTNLGCQNIKVQTPSQAMGLWTDSKLKKLELWEPGRPHAMDAVRHLLYYITVYQGDNRYIERLRDER